MFVILSLLIAVASAAAPVDFTPVFSRPTLTSLGVSVANPPAGKTVFLGWTGSATPVYPAEALVCAPGAVATCLDITCSAANSCQVRNPTILTTNTVTATSISVVRPLVGDVTLADGTPMYLQWALDNTPTGTSALTATMAQTVSWAQYQLPLPAHTPTTVPTFPVNFSRPSATTMGVSFPAPPAGQTIFYGWRATETVGFPADVLICAPGSVATCLDVTCSAANTCQARNPSVLTTNTVTATSISVVRPLSPLVEGGKQWLAYTTAATASGTTTIDATTAQSKSWSYYTADVPAYTPTTAPSFPINITRSNDTDISVSVPQPPANQMLFYGWRSAETVGWPADALICAPGAVSTCLDVSCTSASTCVARTPTILLSNTVSATAISFSRKMASGNVPIVAGSKMYLAYSTAAIPSGTTTLVASAAQSRSWSYYTADVPAVKSGARTFFPALVAAVVTLLYVL